MNDQFFDKLKKQKRTKENYLEEELLQDVIIIEDQKENFIDQGFLTRLKSRT